MSCALKAKRQDYDLTPNEEEDLVIEEKESLSEAEKKKDFTSKNISEIFQAGGQNKEVEETEKEISAEINQADSQVDHLETVNVEVNPAEEEELMIAE